jgi:fatty-acyl-CoA synthase
MSPALTSTTEVATLADIEALEQVPLAERDLPESTYAMLRQGAADAPQKTALQFFLRGAAYRQSVDWTFAELMERITQAANLFHELGVRQGDVVSYVLPNVPETHAVLWGAEAAGVANPINPLLDPEAMRNLMRAAETKVLVTLAPFPQTDLWEKVASVQTEVPSLETILTVDLSRYVTGLRGLGVKAWSTLTGGHPSPTEQGPSIERLQERLSAQPADRRISDRTIQPDDVASLFHTGGTTGAPKLAARTHRNEVFDAWAGATVTDVDGDDTLFCGLPLFHAHAALILGLAPWSRGARVVMGTPKGYRDPDVIPQFWSILQHYDANVFSGVPTVFSALLSENPTREDAAPVDFAFSGAAPLPVEVFERFEAETGVPILEGYGLTEGTCVSSVNPRYGERRAGSVGLRMPYQEMTAAVLGEDGSIERKCAPGEVGTLLLRGPNVFAGYERRPTSEQAWVEANDGGEAWLNTGDRGRQDEDGYFWIVGREKDLIIRGGHNIDPQMIEDPLHEHPDVELVAAVGRPDAYAGQVPVAYVQLRDGATGTDETLLDYAENHVNEQAAVPKQIHVVDALPQTSVGKLFKPALRRREIADVYRAAVVEAPGVVGADVNAVADSTHGTLVQIHGTVDPSREPADVRVLVEDRLAPYTTEYELTLDPPR